MVPSYQVPEIPVVSILVADSVSRFGSADFAHVVSPEFLFDVGPFHYLLRQVLLVGRVAGPQLVVTYIYDVFASKVVEPACQMGLGTIILRGRNRDLVVLSRDVGCVKESASKGLTCELNKEIEINASALEHAYLEKIMGT